MSEIIFQTYIIALPIILTSFMGYVTWLLKNQKKSKDAEKNGIMLLLRVQLIKYHDEYINRGEISTYEYQNFIEMYKAYHDLKGNGLITKMKEEIDELHFSKKGDD